MPLQQTSTGTLNDLIHQSNIEQSVKNSLMTAFALFNIDEEQAMVELLSEEPAWLDRFANNVKQKQTAIAQDDTSAMNKIALNEKEMLMEFLRK